MTSPNGFPTDTRLRTLAEVMTRLIKPIPGQLVSKTDTGDYVNVTNLKDLLDWACGFGRWRAEVLPNPNPVVRTFYAKRGQSPVEGFLYTMVVRLSIQVEDQATGLVHWLSQDGTGTELLTGSPVFGDVMTNAYAQALRRAAESFGLARELWRRDKQKNVQYSKAQMAAREYIKAHPDGGGGATEELPRAEEHPEAERVYQLHEEEGQGEEAGDQRRAPAPAPPEEEHAPEAADDKSPKAKALRLLQKLGDDATTEQNKKGSKAATAGQLQMLETRASSLAKRLKPLGLEFDIHTYVETQVGVAVHNLTFGAAKIIIDHFTEWLKAPAKGAQQGAAKS